MAPSMWQLLIVLAIVVLLFGTKRLKSIGGDLGGAIKGFKKAMGDEQEQKDQSKVEHKPEEPATKTTSDEKSTTQQ